MALTDSEKYKNGANKRRAINAPTNKHWSDSQKLEAVTTYLALGQITLTSAVLKIPEITLRSWKSTNWWKDLEDEMRVQDELQLTTRLKRLVEKGLVAIEDRLDHGDWVYDNKTGQLVRKPSNLKDVHKVTMDMVNKKEALIDKPRNSVAMEEIDAKLQKLAEKFEQIASGNSRMLQDKSEVIEVEVHEISEDGGTIDAIPD